MRNTLRIASAVAASAVLVGGLTACSSKSGSGSDAKGGASAAASAGASGAASAGAAGATGGAGSAAGGAVTGLAPKEALLASAAVMDKAGSAKATIKGASAEDGGTGVIVWKNPAAFELTSKSQGQEYKFLLIGDTIYVGAPQQLAALAGGKTWMKIDPKAGAKPGTADPGSYATTAQMMNPAIQLVAAAPTATKVGAEKVDGADTVHYRSAVPVETLAAGMNLPADLKAKVVDQLKKSGSSTTVELWINAKGELVQLSGTQLGVGDGGTSTVKYSELGTVAAPKAPAADQVFDLAELLAKGGQ